MQQLGTPKEIYDNPANIFVAGFMGSPSMNLFPAKVAVENGRPVACVALADGSAAALPFAGDGMAAHDGRDVILGIRPEAITDEDGADRKSRAIHRISARVEVTESDEEVVATVTGGDLGVLIGRHGQMIDALQYLANAMAHRSVGDDRRRIVVDAAGYRARRSATLETLARRSAEQASATGRRVELEPMSAVERRLVHEALKDDPEVETTSEGVEPNRYVVVLPRRSAD